MKGRSADTVFRIEYKSVKSKNILIKSKHLGKTTRKSPPDGFQSLIVTSP